MLRGTAREAAAEFLGTFILLMFGIGVVAQFVLSGGKNGQYLSINIAWGLGVTMGAYVAAGVSGAHLNPALTLALRFGGTFPGARCCPTWPRSSPAPSRHQR
jgi:glycerol uptake facilitator-like aquaporin